MAAPFPRYRLYGGNARYFKFLAALFGAKYGGEQALRELESQVCSMLGAQNAVCVPQNRVGVYYAVKALIKPGQSVIMSPYTIADIINMVIVAGGRPLFADIERETCNIDAKEVELLLNSSKDVGAVLVTHLHGLAAPTHQILEMCRSRGIPLIEDAAQGFGTVEQGKRLGTIGDVGVYSFGMFKNVSSWFGGMVVSKNREITEAIRKEMAAAPEQALSFIGKKVRKGFLTDLSTWPPLFKLFTFWIFRYAYLNDIEKINKMVRTELDVSPKAEIPPHYLSRLRPFQAILALSQLPAVDRESDIRIKSAAIYHQGLRDIPGLIIPPLRTDRSHIYTYFPVQYREREKLIKWMMKHNCDLAAQHYKNCADLPGFKAYYRDCPNSRAVSQELIFLPTYPSYPQSDVTRNVAVIREFFAAEANRPLHQAQAA